MVQQDRLSIRTAEVVLPCDDLAETLAFFSEGLGFRIDTIFPADAPSVAVLSGYGIRLRLQPDTDHPPGVLRLYCKNRHDPESLWAPNGTRIDLIGDEPGPDLPECQPTLVVTKMNGPDAWGVGRAGMQYRDLIPGRQGGRLIASHIRIVAGGPVPDYVHYHRVRFQMIFCYRGWVRVVYEDQGPAFVLHAGDCVLQPPGIRHRVLESSAGLEVIEISSPAEHMTYVEHELSLPTDAVHPERKFGGQEFVFHQAESAVWQPWRLSGLEARDTGIGAATGGLLSARVVRVSGPADPAYASYDGEMLFMFVLQGGLTFSASGHDDQRLSAGDAILVPGGQEHLLQQIEPELELLEVALSAVSSQR